MVKIPHRDIKLARLKWYQRNKCGCGCGRRLDDGTMDAVSDLHHLLNDTAGNRQKYPVYIHSVLNLRAVRHGCHMTRFCGSRSVVYAAMAERFLGRHPLFRELFCGDY